MIIGKTDKCRAPTRRSTVPPTGSATDLVEHRAYQYQASTRAQIELLDVDNPFLILPSSSRSVNREYRLATNTPG